MVAKGVDRLTHWCQSNKCLLKQCYTLKRCLFPLSWKCLHLTHHPKWTQSTLPNTELWTQHRWMFQCEMKKTLRIVKIERCYSEAALFRVPAMAHWSMAARTAAAAVELPGMMSGEWWAEGRRGVDTTLRGWGRRGCRPLEFVWTVASPWGGSLWGEKNNL